jgi:PTS system nitrogen regulatory IIA component
MPHTTFTIDQLADYLHVARRHVERLVQEGDIPCALRGGRMLFQRDEIDAWASQRILRLPGRGLDWYHRKTMRGTQQLFPQGALIPALLRPECIELDLPSKTKASVIRDMVALADRTGRVFDPRELLDSVEAREALCSTALPGGLALLHARQHQAFRFEGSFIVLGRTIQAIPFGAPDGRATQLFFLVCCQDDRIHLHTLARLCLLALKTNIIAQLAAATDPGGAYEALVAAEQAVLPAKVEIPEKRTKGRRR